MSAATEGVILLHGLGRTERSMRKMASMLEREGYAVVNADYASRKAAIETLSEATIAGALRAPELAGCGRIHFVTHSMGGILVRDYFARHTDERLGRVVMLGPPNQGSEVVDRLGATTAFRLINGPAGTQLGTTVDSVPNRLGPVRFETGVIAGDRTLNWINSAMIAGCDDGKVSIARTRVAGMKAHAVVHATHPFLMRNSEAIRQTVQFLRTGAFLPE